MNKSIIITNICCSCLLILAVPAGISMGKSISEPIERKRKAIEAVQSGYTVYLDGVEIPSSNIDLTLYTRFSIDDELHIVYIAR